MCAGEIFNTQQYLKKIDQPFMWQFSNRAKFLCFDQGQRSCQKIANQKYFLFRGTAYLCIHTNIEIAILYDSNSKHTKN